jgi:hypothetical protein
MKGPCFPERVHLHPKGKTYLMVVIPFEGGDKRATFVGETISKSIRLE